MWVFPHYVYETLGNVFNSRMGAKGKSTPITDSVRNNDAGSWKLLWSYFEVVNSLLKKLTTNQVIGNFDAGMLLYMQPSNIKLQQYSMDLIAKFYKAADVYDEETLDNGFIEWVNVS